MFNNVVFLVNNSKFFISHRLNIALNLKEKSIQTHLYAPHLTSHDNQTLIDAGVIFHKLPFDRKNIKIIDLINIFFKMFFIKKNNSKTIFHLITIIPIIFCGIPLRLLRQKIVFSIPGLGTLFISDKFSIKITRFFIKRIYRFLFNAKNSRVIVQNKHDYQFLTEIIKIKRDNISLIKGSGVNKNEFLYYEEEPTNDIPIILVPARLIREKGIIEIVNASILLKEQNIEHNIYIAGTIDPGNPSSLTETDIKILTKKSPCVHFLGHIEDMKPLYKNCTIVCLPSYREGLPKALIEAAACGRAIVTCDVPGCNEIVEHNISGLLVPAASIIELSEALKLLILNQDLRARLRKNAYHKFLIEFTEELVVNENINVYLSFNNYK